MNSFRQPVLADCHPLNPALNPGTQPVHRHTERVPRRRPSRSRS